MSIASGRCGIWLLVVSSAVSGAAAQAQVQTPSQTKPTASAAVPSSVPACEKSLAALNAGLSQREAEALLAAADLLEAGRCVARDDTRAAEYLSEAARGGHRPAALRLARKFGRGAGVPQSYANAGAWITGKGHSDERIEPWDYSIGYAYTVASELLTGVRYPPLVKGQPAQVSFAIEIDALHPTRMVFRETSPTAPGSAALVGALKRAFEARVTEVTKWLPAPDKRWLVAARVTVPMSIRYDSPTSVAALEDELLLR